MFRRRITLGCVALVGVVTLFVSSIQTASAAKSSRLWTEEADQLPLPSDGTTTDEVDDSLARPSDNERSDNERLVSNTTTFEEALSAQEGSVTGQACCNGCGRCGNACCDRRLFGLFAQSDYCFSNFVSPLTNPLFFEDPRTLTETRTIYAHQWIPGSNPVFGGGTAQYLAMQMRAALTTRLSLIATKDGYFWINPGTPGAQQIDGWANLALGLKYNLIRDVENQRIWSAGFTYQPPTGTTRVFQGLAGGEFHAFLTGGRQILDRGHFVTGTGYRFAATPDLTDMIYWSNHWDYEFLPTLYGLFEINWFHWTRSGSRLAVDFEGNDLLNLGATNVAGNNIVTMGVGARKRFGQVLKHELGAGYEIPLTARRDLLNNRLYLDVLLRF